jgi:hypothetical protein
LKNRYSKELLNKDHTMCRKERFMEIQTAGLPPLGSECSSLAAMASGLYKSGQIMRKGESYWSPIICDHQMEWADMPSLLRNWKLLRFCKWGNKQGNKQGSFASGHKSGSLVVVLALGLSTHYKNARDLTFQPFVGIMGANRSSCFVLSGGIVKEGFSWNLEVCEVPRR